MLTISLLDFLRTGEFGPIREGWSRDRIFEALGEPDAWGTNGNRELATIWLYGTFEIYFGDGSTDRTHTFVFTDHLKKPIVGGVGFDLEHAELLEGEPLLDELASRLSDHAIGFEEVEISEYFRPHGLTTALRTEGGVRLYCCPFGWGPDDSSWDPRLRLWWLSNSKED